jgi:PAS domain S-box/diguanylate cyclase (GGDEF) domain
MINYFEEALDKVNNGVIIIDSDQKILFWNHEIAKMSNIQKETALGRNLYEVCPKFAEKRYQDILQNLFSTGQSRFCSSVLHKFFITPANVKDPDLLRQNLYVDPIKISGEIQYAFLQLADVTEQMQNEIKLKILIDDLKKGYRVVKKSEVAALKKANFDPLTDILNRSGLESELQKALSAAASQKQKLIVFFLDLDNFKYVNDAYGHIVGDVLLQQVVGRLKGYIRHKEKRTRDIFGRIGGDEFIIVLPNISDSLDIVLIADRIIKSINKPFYIDMNEINISLSLGISIYPDDADTVKLLINRADKAMYRVKQSGKNRFEFYQPPSHGHGIAAPKN